MSLQPSIYHGASLQLCLFAQPKTKPRRRFDAGRMNSHGPLLPLGPNADRISNTSVLHSLKNGLKSEAKQFARINGSFALIRLGHTHFCVSWRIVTTLQQSE
jgi:hypothetical protein